MKPKHSRVSGRGRKGFRYVDFFGCLMFLALLSAPVQAASTPNDGSILPFVATVTPVGLTAALINAARCLAEEKEETEAKNSEN